MVWMGKLVHLKKHFNNTVDGLNPPFSVTNHASQEVSEDTYRDEEAERRAKSLLPTSKFEAEMTKFFHKQIIGFGESFGNTRCEELSEDEQEDVLPGIDRLKIFKWAWVRYILSLHKKAVSGRLNQLRCCDCQMQFFNISDISIHEWNCMAGKRPYKCGHCDKLFKYYFGMAGHIENHSNEEKRALKLDKEECKFSHLPSRQQVSEETSVYSLSDSQSSCAGEEESSSVDKEQSNCIEEVYVKQEPSCIGEHADSDLPSDKPGFCKGMYCCSFCGQLFNRRKYYVQHKDYHRNEKNPLRKCTFCKSWFYSAEVAKNHEQVVHSVELAEWDYERPVPDSNALSFIYIEVNKWYEKGVDYPTLKGFKREKRFECVVCLRKFTTEHFVQKHMIRDHCYLLKILVAINHLLYLTVRRLTDSELLSALSMLSKTDILIKLEELSKMDKDFIDNFQHIGSEIDAFNSRADDLSKDGDINPIFIEVSESLDSAGEKSTLKTEIKMEPVDEFGETELIHSDEALKETPDSNEGSDSNYSLENCSQQKKIYSKTSMIECPVCHKKLSPRTNMKMHLLIHTDIREHECPYCHQKYTLLSTLKRHIRTHTGDKPFVCEFCNKAYSQSTNLKRHIRTHTGYRPFKCHLCPKNYCDKFSLTRHIKTHD